MGISLIEQIGIVAGIVIGVSGFIYSIAQSRRQRQIEREQAAFAREQAELAREQAEFAREQAAKQEAFEREQAAEQRKWEEKQAAEQRKREEEQAAKQEIRDRLLFLADIIVNKDIPRNSRQVFFDEYVAKGGNGSFIKYWYDEGKELESRQ